MAVAAGGEGGRESGEGGGYQGDPNYTGEQEPIDDPEWGGTPESRGVFIDPIEN